MSDDSIVIDMFYPYPVSQVWAALTDPAALGTWLMPNDFEPRLGHRFTFQTVPSPDHSWNGVVQCEVVTLDEPHRVAYTWRGGGGLIDTLVTFTIEPAEGGTNLRLEHTGFAATGPGGLTIRDILASGWDSTLLRQRLPAYLSEQAHKKSTN